MKKLKLIACDLDGTLLLHGAQKCDAQLFPLITQLKEENVLFCAASGRQYQSLQNLFYPIKDEILYICENGMQIIYKDKILNEETLDPSLAFEICNAILEYEGCEIMVSSSHTSYVLNRNKEYIRYLKEDVKNKVDIIEHLEEIQGAILKVAAFVPKEKIHLLQEELYQRFHSKCQVLTSGSIWIDFVPCGIDKGYAIKKVAKLLNIDLKDMAAFGDNENDRTMLEAVRYAYLMKTCNPSMKSLNNTYIECKKVEESLQEIIENGGCVDV